MFRRVDALLFFGGIPGDCRFSLLLSQQQCSSSLGLPLRSDALVLWHCHRRCVDGLPFLSDFCRRIEWTGVVVSV